MTCRTYAEGQLLAKNSSNDSYGKNVDIEDLCQLCDPLETEEVEAAAEDEAFEETSYDLKETPLVRKRGASGPVSRAAKSQKLQRGDASKQQTLRDFASFRSTTTRNHQVKDDSADQVKGLDSELDAASLASIITYCSLFPKREPKNKVPEEECLVCIIRFLESPTDGERGSKWLIEQRPSKGLLASLWQFPSYTLPSTNTSTASSRKKDADKFVRSLSFVTADIRVKHLGEKGDLTHIFSHLKLKMYIHCFDVQYSHPISVDTASGSVPKKLWLDERGVNEATLSTGIRKCWDLARKIED